MKTAAKVLVIVGIVTMAIYAFLSIFILALVPLIPSIETGNEYSDIFFSTFFTTYFTTFGVTMIITSIPAIIFGIIALVKLAKPGKPSIGISICTLLFCNIVAGILMLCIPEERPALVESTPSTDA